MNWEILGSIAEAIGALAVIGTLLYLSIQIRSQVVATKAQVLQERSNRLQDLNLTIANSEDLARIQTAIFTLNEDGFPQIDPDAVNQLSPTDFIRYRNFLAANYFRLQNLIAQYELGTMDQKTVGRAFGSIERSIPTWRAFNQPIGDVEKALERFRGRA